jgi:hypothetical protein
MYDATLGRFLQRDPAGYVAADMNLYGYVSDSPASSLDAMGAIVISSRSGINDPNSSIQTDIVRSINDRTNPNVTAGGHIGSTLTTASLLAQVGRANQTASAATTVGMLGSSLGQGPLLATVPLPPAFTTADILNQEAQAIAQQFSPGDFCKPRRCGKTKIGVVMVAPKLQISRFLQLLRDPDSCCDIKVRTFFSSNDWVPNQVPGAPENWNVLGPAHDIRLSGLWNHGWDPNRGRAPGVSGSPLHPANDYRATVWMNGAYAANPISFRTEIFSTLSANTDYGYVCHSQGCNIMMYELIRRCTRFAGS